MMAIPDEAIPATPRSLAGQVVVVTGASRGLGWATTQAVIEAGGRVVAVVRTQEADRQLRHRFADGVAVLVADATQEAAAHRAMGLGLERWGSLNGLINNAGSIQPIGRFADCDVAQWEGAIATNIVAPFRFCRAFMALTAPGSIRRIVNISSGAARAPLLGWSAYCTGKAGLALMTRCIHTDHAADGVRAFSVAPGVLDTDMQAEVRASGMNDVSRLPRSSLRPPAEPARAIAFLLSGGGDDLAGDEIDVRDKDFRQRSGLPSLA
jgi:NAD(P)-dependent dehydrogenase (short-subunit alcohol dehydrogenase family)